MAAKSRPWQRVIVRATSWVLLAVGSLAAGCVVPLKPEFEDPEKNYAPYIDSASPAIGTVVTAPPDVDPPFIVYLKDPNQGDVLYVRWIFNYPPYDGNTGVVNIGGVPPAADPTVARRVAIAVNCIDSNLPLGAKQHRVMLAVSDRKFKGEDGSDQRATLVQPGAHLLVATWLLNKECGK